MSVLTVQLGQCGNQIGSQFFSTVAVDLQSLPNRRIFSDFEDDCVDRFFSVDKDGKWTARAVMVDTEPKVLITVLFICLMTKPRMKTRRYCITYQ